LFFHLIIYLFISIRFFASHSGSFMQYTKNIDRLPLKFDHDHYVHYEFGDHDNETYITTEESFVVPNNSIALLPQIDEYSSSMLQSLEEDNMQCQIKIGDLVDAILPISELR